MKKRSTTPLQARRGDPHGQVLVLFALMLVVLLLVSALAVDYGGWLVAKRNYQNFSDAASLAGAQQLTRPLSSACAPGLTKNFCARQAAWESINTALGFTGLAPATQANTALNPSTAPYSENGYTVWVASPPSDAGSAYVGHISGPGNVYVRIDHAATTFLSNIASINRTVQAWSTAGRFPANFAVIGMCSPTSVTANCLAGDANIKLDGSNTNLIIGTGDLGTNRWVKTGGSSSGVALGQDSNAYMQLFDTCWASSTNQCQLWSYSGGVIDSSSLRSAIPLGAPVPNPNYPEPTITGTTAPNQCLGSGSVTLASLDGVQAGPQTAAQDLPIRLASVVLPRAGGNVANAANVAVSGFVKSLAGSLPLSGIVVTSNPDNGNSTTNAAGFYSMNIKDNATYTLTATDPAGVYATTTRTVVVGSGAVTVPDILMPKNPVVSGVVTSTTTGLPLNNVAITITAFGTPYTTTTNAAGVYSRIIPVAGAAISYTIAGVLSGYVSGGTSVAAPTAFDTNYPNKNFTLTVTPASITGTVTDKATLLPIPNVTVTLSSGQSATTDLTGTYTVPAATVGSITFNLSSAAGTTAILGYLPANAASSHPTPYTTNVAAGANSGAAFNFALWPKGCNDSGGDRGDWSCGFSTADCGTVTNPNAANVSCSKFDNSNAIRPGTYNDITISSGTCAWLDPRGGATGLAAGQSAGIYHIKGSIDIRSDAYLFGDGITIVFDQGSNIDVANGGGFVLNYGSLHSTPSNTATACNLSSQKLYGDGYTPCFRTVADTEDYAYAAWTSTGRSFWSSATFPTYDDSVLSSGELGITFFMHGSGLGTNSRFKISTANMGYLFNGVLYAPNDDVELGGGKNGQTAAGQIVGWTIEYHGGTSILQNWYGPPIDGQPFLIEPILGE